MLEITVAGKVKVRVRAKVQVRARVNIACNQERHLAGPLVGAVQRQFRVLAVRRDFQPDVDPLLQHFFNE